ncbi:hypothetical protein [Paenibacillus daejeonensis]|uniref:hypothetical protein n=1 Tax=Paenibacillus daejeonensis TaxID=135193 RepID=UPI00037EEA75|nr:hypothetical protein [Paenibacillus daejeonensis]
MNIGDIMTPEEVEGWINVMPPATQQADLVQLGEPYTHRPDAEGHWRATYPTAVKVAGEWRYMGNCFRGQTICK